MNNKTIIPADKRFALLTTLVYAIVVVILSLRHEVWRDEVVVLSMAADAKSPADLFATIPNFGHPGLWYLILYFGYKILHTTAVLKIMNLLVTTAGVYVFLRRAPFSRLQKVLFIGGLFPLYVYPVINRDYGLAMLLTFAFCALYEHRFVRFVSVGAVLFLLANTHIHSWILVASIFASLVLEFVFSKDSRRQWMARPVDTAIGFTLIALGLAFCIWSTMPNYTWNIARPVISLPAAVKAAVLAVAAPERAFPTLFGFSSALFLKLAAWALAIYLWGRNFYLFAIFAFDVLGLGLFFHLEFATTALRHQAAFYLLLIVILWLDLVSQPSSRAVLLKPLEKIREFVGRNKETALTFVLVLQVCAAYPEIKADLLHDYSPAKRLSQFLKHDPRLHEAVVIPEPDTFAEALPYYARNPIYIAREGRYEKCTQFTTESRSWYSMAELLADSRKVKASTGKPVVILMGHHLSPQGPFKIQFSLGTHKVFTYTPESLRDFYDQTLKVAAFHETLTDEEYDVYLLK